MINILDGKRFCFFSWRNVLHSNWTFKDLLRSLNGFFLFYWNWHLKTADGQSVSFKIQDKYNSDCKSSESSQQITVSVKVISINIQLYILCLQILRIADSSINSIIICSRKCDYLGIFLYVALQCDFDFASWRKGVTLRICSWIRK